MTCHVVWKSFVLVSHHAGLYSDWDFRIFGMCASMNKSGSQCYTHGETLSSVQLIKTTGSRRNHRPVPAVCVCVCVYSLLWLRCHSFNTHIFNSLRCSRSVNTPLAGGSPSSRLRLSLRLGITCSVLLRGQSTFPVYSWPGRQGDGSLHVGNYSMLNCLI